MMRRRLFRLGLCAIALAGAPLCRAEGPQAPAPAGEQAAPAESEVMTVTGVLIRINRKAAWPRLEMQTHGGEAWMLELPVNVTLAWLEGRPQDLDALQSGQWIKVLYVRKADGKKKVKSVQILPGFGFGGPGGEEAPNPFGLPKPPALPVAPTMPERAIPNLPISLPKAPEIKTPEAPQIPAIPDIDTSRRGRY